MEMVMLDSGPVKAASARLKRAKTISIMGNSDDREKSAQNLLNAHQNGGLGLERAA